MMALIIMSMDVTMEIVSMKMDAMPEARSNLVGTATMVALEFLISVDLNVETGGM